MESGPPPTTPQAAWQRHDWRVNPCAPALRIVQALVAGGKTASGAGHSGFDAFSRCLGETAEILALPPHASSEGVAAGPDFAFASSQALCERLERWALWEWWHGQLAAKPVSAPDLVHNLRKGSATPRPTRLWHLPEFAALEVVIALSVSAENDQPVLGFGANLCARKAAESALVELGLMELNLLEPGPTLQAYFQRITPRLNDRLPKGAPHLIAPGSKEAPEGLAQLNARLATQGLTCTFEDLSSPETGLSVAKAHLPNTPSWAQADPGPLI